MISYGHIRTIDERLDAALTRLIRLQQLERDAKSVLTRRDNAYRLATQEGFGSEEVQKRRVRRNQAYDRVRSVQAELSEQETIVRHLREGRE